MRRLAWLSKRRWLMIGAAGIAAGMTAIDGSRGAVAQTPQEAPAPHASQNAASPREGEALRDEPHEATPVVAEHRPTVASGGYSLRALIAHRLHDVAAREGEPVADGGVPGIPAGVFLQFRGDVIVRITAHATPWTPCIQVARQFGFESAMPPIRRAHWCEWPATSTRHLLAHGIGGRMDLPTGAFEVWTAE